MPLSSPVIASVNFCEAVRDVEWSPPKVWKLNPSEHDYIDLCKDDVIQNDLDVPMEVDPIQIGSNDVFDEAYNSEDDFIMDKNTSSNDSSVKSRKKTESQEDPT